MPRRTLHLHSISLGLFAPTCGRYTCVGAGVAPPALAAASAALASAGTETDNEKEDGFTINTELTLNC